jgi:flagellar basal body-associated protein FliL
MADDAALEEAPPQQDKKRGLLVPVLATGVVAVLLSVGGTIGGLYAAGMFDAPAAAADAGGSSVAAGEPGLPDSVVGTLGIEVVPLKKFQANLKDGSGGRKISIDISLEGRSVDGKSSLGEAVTEKEAAIRDTVNFLLMDFTFAELRGTDGMLRLRDEIHRRLDVHLEDMGVRLDRVYFTDVVVQ